MQASSGMQQQQGATLIMTLLVLLVVSLLAISSAERATLQDRMVGSQRDADIAFEMAEEALNEAETLLETGQVTPADFSAQGPFYSQGEAPDPFEHATWEPGGGSREATATHNRWVQEYSDATIPRFIIERIGRIGDGGEGSVMVGGRQQLAAGGQMEGYRVIVRSRGATGHSDRILEGYFAADLR